MHITYKRGFMIGYGRLLILFVDMLHFITDTLSSN